MSLYYTTFVALSLPYQLWAYMHSKISFFFQVFLRAIAWIYERSQFIDIKNIYNAIWIYGLHCLFFSSSFLIYNTGYKKQKKRHCPCIIILITSFVFLCIVFIVQPKLNWILINPVMNSKYMCSHRNVYFPLVSL